jgi:N-acetylmuramoyl-L-alanine amidase
VQAGGLNLAQTFRIQMTLPRAQRIQYRHLPTVCKSTGSHLVSASHIIRAGFAAALLLAAGFLGQPGHAQQAQPGCASASAPTLIAVEPRFEAAEGRVTFHLTMSAAAEIRIEHLERPLRIIAELPEANIQSVARRPSGLINGFRAGLVAPGRSRMVFDLTQPARVARVIQQPRPGGVSQLSLVFEPAAAAEFERAAAADAERRARAALAPIIPRPNAAGDRKPTVVIDPGHGGIDPGAVAEGGVTEKGIVLAIALRLRDAIEAGGQARVVMTRADDRFLSLSERVRIARENQADLFISLHADSLSAAQDVRGATVYTGSERATDAESARLAQKENASDAVGGADAAAGGEEVLDILNDLARRETRALSSVAASRLVTEMSGAVRMHRIPQRSAGFRVLIAPDVPSVLIELGYLSSRGDIALLTSEAWQKTAADAIAGAVRRYLDVRGRQGP